MESIRAFYHRHFVAGPLSTVLLLLGVIQWILDWVGLIDQVGSMMNPDYWFTKVILWPHLGLVTSVIGLALLVYLISKETSLGKADEAIRDAPDNAPSTSLAAKQPLEVRFSSNPEYKATLEEARGVLDELEGEFSPQELAKAYEGLEKGDPTNAETLFRRILAVGSTVSVSGSREKSFKAALMLSLLAEGRGDGQAALRYNKQAMELKPSGLTSQGYGLVGDDVPKVIVALSTIQSSKRTISGIHEATGVNESAIEHNLEWLTNNGLAVKSETDSPYWRLTPKGRGVFTSLLK